MVISSSDKDTISLPTTATDSTIPSSLIVNQGENSPLLDRVGDTEHGYPASDHIKSTTPPRLSPRVWITLVASVFLGLVSGTIYGYGRYARDLKDTLELSQFELERFGILLDTGNYFGHPITGYVYDHFGPQISCLASAAVVFCAYGMIHLGVADAPGTTFPSGVLDTAFFLVGFGTGLGYIAALGATTKNFSKTPYRSMAIAIVASGYGLCSTIVGLSYYWLGLTRFFLFWAILVAAVNVLGAAVFQYEEGRQNHDGQSPSRKVDHDCEQQEDCKSLNPSQENTDPKGIISRSDSVLSVIADNIASRLSALYTGDFWMLFAAFACCTGCGLFVINNISLMVQSIGGHDDVAGHLVILLSFCNCAGRILMGSLADRQSKLGLLAMASLVMSFGLFLSAQATMENAHVRLVVTVVTVAMAYGGLWVLIVGILSEWFGTTDFGTNYGVIAMGPALSGMIFNASSAWMYERRGVGEGGSVCLGTECYRGSFFMASAAALMTTLLLWCLASRRTKSARGSTQDIRGH